MADPFVSKDDASSVYSRSPDSPKGRLNLINTLDHQLAMSSGTSMALETTRSRLQRSKSKHRMSLPELRDSKIRIKLATDRIGEVSQILGSEALVQY
jgi:hypothetical protein